MAGGHFPRQWLIPQSNRTNGHSYNQNTTLIGLLDDFAGTGAGLARAFERHRRFHRPAAAVVGYPNVARQFESVNIQIEVAFRLIVQAIWSIEGALIAQAGLRQIGSSAFSDPSVAAAPFHFR
ncbi:MAG: hypothetical protein F4X41_00360 [Chloroflexi bacterium]|nr:hypothetical protein [Chloroflexota bacterium]